MIIEVLFFFSYILDLSHVILLKCESSSNVTPGQLSLDRLIEIRTVSYS